MSVIIKVGFHVTYIDAAGRHRPATVTKVWSSVEDPAALDLRIGYHGETYENVPMRAYRNHTDCWFQVGRWASKGDTPEDLMAQASWFVDAKEI